MEVHQGLDWSSGPSGSVVTVGTYDGVHLGHRALIAETRRRARELGLESVVVTFDRHPATVVRPDRVPPLLTGLEDKLALLQQTGVDRVVVLPFDEQRANESAEEFVQEVLVRGLRARQVVVGENFRFGHGRKGDVRLLAELGAVEGFEVIGWPLARDPEGNPVSSTRVRQLILEGRVDQAAELLGRPHRLAGPVVPGDGRGGKELGMPTANLQPPAGLAVPPDGIYACWARLPDGRTWPAVVSVGDRPTFYAAGGDRLLEVHLLDFDQDLYGQRLAVDFVARRRPQQRFSTPQELAEAMVDDARWARSVLADPPTLERS
jgi:riboflavin kinase/FMN adenylyltransferase